MRSCSICKKLRIVRGCLEDYKQLAHYHYRDSRLTAYAAIFALRFGDETIGVIVYTMPSPRLELRNIATGNLFAGFDKRTQLALINKNIRRISRVIIDSGDRKIFTARPSKSTAATRPAAGTRSRIYQAPNEEFSAKLRQTTANVPRGRANNIYIEQAHITSGLLYLV